MLKLEFAFFEGVGHRTHETGGAFLGHITDPAIRSKQQEAGLSKSSSTLLLPTTAWVTAQEKADPALKALEFELKLR